MSDSREIELVYPDLGVILRGSLLTHINRELADLLWEHLPFETIQSHPMSSGQGMYAPHRIVGLVKTETQLITELPVGAMAMSTVDYKTISLYYGRMTEPLPVSPVARIREEDLKLLEEVGRKVWLANFYTHEPIRLTVRRAG